MAKTSEPAGLLIAKESWVGTLGGKLVEVSRGEIAEAGSAVALQWPDKFAPLEPRYRRTPAARVEQATAAPGEKRGA